jgi:hypothetical protein
MWAGIPFRERNGPAMIFLVAQASVASRWPDRHGREARGWIRRVRAPAAAARAPVL